MTGDGYTVTAVHWQEKHAQLSAVRRKVFIEEQSVPEALEWDGLDEGAVHILARDNEGRAIGCARLLPEGKIGRMAVLPEWRGKGIGRAVLQNLLTLAREKNLDEVRASAQVAAVPFYERAGFKLCSGVYMDAGIPHRDMYLKLTV